MRSEYLLGLWDGVNNCCEELYFIDFKLKVILLLEYFSQELYDREKRLIIWFDGSAVCQVSFFLHDKSVSLWSENFVTFLKMAVATKIPR